MEEEKKELEVQEESKELIEEPSTAVNQVEEEKQDSVDEVLPGPNAIKKLEDERPYNEIIEEARLAFNAKYKKSRMWSYIMMGIVLVVAVASVIMTTRSEMVFKIIGWSLIGSAVIGMLVFYVVTRNKLPEQTKEYIKLVNEVLNSHNYTDNKISDASADEKEKIEMGELSCDGIYKDLNQIASRNVIHGKYNNHSFVAGDVGLYKASGRNRASVFVGKYLSMPNDLHFEGHYIVTIKGESPVDLPDDIDNLASLVDEGNFIIYGPKDGNVEKALGKKVLPLLRKFAIDDVLLNVNFVFWAGHSAVYLSYCDDVMTLPFQNTFTGASNNKFRNDLFAAFEVLNTLNK